MWCVVELLVELPRQADRQTHKTTVKVIKWPQLKIKSHAWRCCCCWFNPGHHRSGDQEQIKRAQKVRKSHWQINKWKPIIISFYYPSVSNVVFLLLSLCYFFISFLIRNHNSTVITHDTITTIAPIWLMTTINHCCGFTMANIVHRHHHWLLIQIKTFPLVYIFAMFHPWSMWHINPKIKNQVIAVMLCQNQINPWFQTVEAMQAMSMISNRIYITRHHRFYHTNRPAVAVVVVIIIITIRDNQDNVGHQDASPITRSDTIQVRLLTSESFRYYIANLLFFLFVSIHGSIHL